MLNSSYNYKDVLFTAHSFLQTMLKNKAGVIAFMKIIKRRSNKNRNKKSGIAITMVMLSLVLFMTPFINKFSGFFAATIAGITMPDGGRELLFQQIYGNPVETIDPKNNANNKSDLPDIFSSASSGSILSGNGQLKQIQLSPMPDIDEAHRGKIVNMTIGNTGTNYGNVWIKNSTEKAIDIETLLNSSPDIDSFENGDEQPVVLIYHTHSTESYINYDGDYYDTQWSGRSQDEQTNIIAVGEVIADKLRAAGIGVIHDTAVYDSPAYKGAYERSGQAIDQYLEQYPTIQVALDIHRDSMTRDDGTKISPVVEIDGKNAAQIMIIAGCETDTSLPNPNWENNLIFAANLQNIIESKYQGLARPINFMVAQYNQHRSRNSLLIEIGTDSNNINEALYSGWLVGDCLSELLAQYEQ